MPDLAQSILRGLKNLDRMSAETGQLISLVRELYVKLEMASGELFFTAGERDEEVWWECYATKVLQLRCISKHPSVMQTTPAIVFATTPAWREITHSKSFAPPHYDLELGIKGTLITYKSLDMFLEEVFIRWPSMRGYLQPMIGAADYFSVTDDW